MTIPIIAIVGRPNVGKSTLFNRLTRSRDALVADYAGLTRDRKYGRALLSGHPFLLIDTGGLSGGEVGIDAAMAQQSKAAIEEADAVVFMVDATSGVAASDQTVADMLRRIDKPVWLAANKIDGQNTDIALSDFYGLGFGEPQAIAASLPDSEILWPLNKPFIKLIVPATAPANELRITRFVLRIK